MPVDPTSGVFAPRPVKVKTKTTPPAPPGFGNLGGTFAPGGFIPTKPKVALPPDQAPYKHGQSPDQTKTKALAQGGEVKLIDTGAHPQATQRAAQTMALQRVLVAKGAKISVDGVWGPRTEAAYQAYLHHAAQYTQQAQQVDATRNPLFQQAPSAETVHEQMLLQQEAARRAALARATPEVRPQEQYSSAKRYAPAYKGEPVDGWEGGLKNLDGTWVEPGTKPQPGAYPAQRPYYTQSYTHQSHAGEVAAMNDETNFEAMFGKQTEKDLEQSPKIASPALTGTLEAIGGALPGVGLAKAAEAGHLTGRSVVGEVANDLLWLGPGELAAPFKFVGGTLKTARSGADIADAARGAVTLWREKKLARIENPIIRRDLNSSPDRQSFIAAIRDVPKLTGTEQHALIQVADHNAITRAAMTGEKPSIAWGKANFGKSTFHDINPTKDEALGVLAQHEGDTHFQVGKLTGFPDQSAWNDPAKLKTQAFNLEGPGAARVPFVSKLHALVFDMPPKVGVNELLGKLKSAGVKGDEIKWNRFDEFLAGASAKGQKSVTREEALGWLDKNYLQLEENRRFGAQETAPWNGGADYSANSDETKFGQYTLPGGREANYQEFTIRLPADQYGDLYYYTGHFPDANIVAHARTTDRTVAGDHSLMIEEIQSDWHQAGQKQGYKVPVTEHPDYETTMQSIEQSQKDADVIANRIRRTITDSVFNHPELPNMPEALRPAFERGGETSIGLNLTDQHAVTDWLDRAETILDELLRHPDERLHVQEMPGGVSHHPDSRRFLVEMGDRRINEFHHYISDEAGLAERNANVFANNWNTVLDMKPAAREDLVNSVKAYADAHRDLLQYRNQLRRLEQEASNGVAQGPFAKTWHELAFKRMLAEAVDKGYERIAWTTGRTQAERYNLANFFKRIEITEGKADSGDALYEWADERAQSSVGDMNDEELGLDSRKEEDLREQASEYVDYPSEDAFYVHEHDDGSTTPASPDDEGAILDDSSYEYAMDEYYQEVDDRYESLLEEWRSDARDAMIDSERDYYMSDADFFDDAPSGGNLLVRATDHNGHTHEYSASSDSSEENYLGNVVGPDVAQRHLEDGETVFEGDNLVAGDNAKSALGAAHFYDNKLTGFVNKYLKQTGVQTSMEEIGNVANRYKVVEASHAPEDSSGGYKFYIEEHLPDGSVRIVGGADSPEHATEKLSMIQNHPGPGAGTVVHSIPVTDEVRKFVDQGIVLFQRDPLVKEIARAQKLAPRMKGAVEITPGAKTDLHLFAAADVSTVVHELGHSVQAAIPSLAGLDPETFARSFERYFMTAKAPTENLTLPFADIREGMLNVYGSPRKVPGARLTAKMKSELDAFFKAAEKEHPDLLRSLTAIHFNPGRVDTSTPQDTHFQAAWGDHETFDTPKPERRGKNRPSLEQLNRDRALLGKEPQIERRGVTPPKPGEKTKFQEGEPEPIQDDTLARTHEPMTEKTPEEALRAGMKGVKIRRGVQDKMRSEERARRARAYAEKLSQGEGIQGHYAALAELKGELPKIDYHGFKELNPEALDYLVNTVRDHPHLLPYQKTRLITALDKATQGTMPTPSEQVLIEHIFGKDTARGFEEIARWPKHLQNLAAEILNVPRSVMASFDLSAPFRQGLVIGTRHPGIFFSNFPAMFKSFGSERVYQAVMDEVRSRPSYPMMHQAKLAITDMEAIDNREEQFYSNLAERISGGKRSPIRMSGRAYTAFLVKTRADVFDHLIRVAERQGIDVQKEKFLKDLGRYINAATGRGNLAALQGAAPFLNTVFFSPRLLASRVDLLFSPITYARADPFVRRQALISMFNLAGAAATVLGLASLLPGVTISGDPRNADFGKIRFGNTRLDILGGFQQPFRLASQFVSGKIISSTTGDALVLGPAGPGGVSRQDIVKRFFEGKLAPVPSIINDWMKGQNFQGQKLSWSQEATSHMIPLLAQDAADLYNREHGGINGIALALAGYGVGAFGIGLQTYGPKNPAQKPTEKLDSEAKKAGMPGPTPELLIDVKHQANLDSLSQKHANDPQGRLDAFLKYYADETGDHQYDKWIGGKLPDDAAKQGADAIRHALVGPGLSQYEAAIRASLKAQGKKW